MKTAYISGPITGIENENRDAFAAAQVYLEAKGYAVINPHVICAHLVESELRHILEPQDKWILCMKECLRRLPDADLVFMLDGWSHSSGAIKENSVAHWLDIPVRYQGGAPF